jgi:hypothetical protein
MTPKLTDAMRKDAIKDGAEVKKKRKVAKPSEVAAPTTPIFPRDPEIDALRAEISELKQALAAEKAAAAGRSQELTAMLAVMSESKPMRIKPIRDMDRDSKTYLLVTHYDFVPVSYQRKLDS